MAAEVRATQFAERLSVRVAAPSGPLALSVLHTLAYSDVFDYPLTLQEIQRYLIATPADKFSLSRSLETELLPGGWIEAHGDFYTLAGRGRLAGVREQRRRQAQCLWPHARRYAGWLWALPYVRMVALTGALAMDNEPGRDLDFLVVTAPGRLWLCRGLAMLLVRLARRFGDELCPNYFISTRALRFPEENLYTAHELAQMIPLYGQEVYGTIRRLNAWTEEFLPNASGAPLSADPVHAGSGSGLRRAAEAVLRSGVGERLEGWEMRRKIRKLSIQRGPEAEFSPDWCKGHFGGYGRKTLEAYRARLEDLPGVM